MKIKRVVVPPIDPIIRETLPASHRIPDEPGMTGTEDECAERSERVPRPIPRRGRLGKVRFRVADHGSICQTGSIAMEEKCGPQDSNLQPRDSSAPAFPRGLDYLILHVSSETTRRPGARRRGLLLGLTPLVSEPSWPPLPGQAWLRIAVLRSLLDTGFRFPAIHPVRIRKLPSGGTFLNR